MTDRLPRIYWDTDVFLSLMARHPQRASVLDRLIERASAGGEMQVVTSTLAVTETAFLETERQRGPAATIEAAFDALWNDPMILLMSVSVSIARAARHLIRQSLVTRPRLKPPDAIHLSTAQQLGVASYHTYDATLHRHSGRVGFQVEVPFAEGASR